MLAIGRIFFHLCRITIIGLTFAVLIGFNVQAISPSSQIDLKANKLAIRDEAKYSTNTSISTETIYLPLVMLPGSFPQNTPIWAHASTPMEHEIALFRHTFSSDVILDNAMLHIFADTRYEVWVDGNWIGRGPARFSRTLREYDVYELGSLSAGRHLIAVLVQWAPNFRRSESITPFLQAHVSGRSASGSQIIVKTSTQWKSLLSDAWRSDAIPVHAWGLIGPTELLDLSRLPPDWNQPSFEDNTWESAVIRDISVIEYQPSIFKRQDYTSIFPETNEYVIGPTAFTTDNIDNVEYQPRSISLSEHVPIPSTVVDAGLLSTDYKIGELGQTITGTYALSFYATNSTDFTVETLTETISLQTNLIQLDGEVLDWQAAGDQRPDVYTATVNIDAGTHQLTFSEVPPQGTTISVSKSNIEYDAIPFQQGVHAGRRLLLANPVSNLEEIEISTIDDLSVVFNTLPGYVILDLGRTVHGRLLAEVSGPSGTVIDIGWDERLLKDTMRPLPYPGSLHPQWNQVDSWILDGNSRSISTLDTRAGRYLLITAWGKGPVQLRNIQIYEERYPLIQMGYFQSSNPLLDQIWQIGVDTIYPNMTDSYSDTPWRERGQWWGDAYVEDHINQVAFGETDLLRRGVLYMADAFTGTLAPGAAPNSNGTNVLDYAMLWVHSLEEYLQQTNDVPFISRVYPVLIQFIYQLEGYENINTGLLDLPETPWPQTAYIGTYGYHSRYGQSTALNAIYYSTLLRAADIADRVGDSSKAQGWRDKAETIRRMTNSLLYLSSDHRYITNVYQDAPYPPSPQAQAWALAYGLVPDDEIDQVVSSLIELISPDPSSPNLSIYGMFWALEALGRTEHIPEALEIIQNYYGAQINSGATTWWERFDAIDSYRTSLSHGWGGSPTWFLTTYVLGLKRLGANTWMIKPSFNGVTHVSGILPLKNGELHARWDIQSAQDKTVMVVSNEGSNGEIVIPYTHPTLVLTLDGEIIWEDQKSLVENVFVTPGEVHIVIPGGNHTLHLHQGD